MALWNVKLIYKETILVEAVEANDKESAIKAALDKQDAGDCQQVDYAWYDANARKIK